MPLFNRTLTTIGMMFVGVTGATLCLTSGILLVAGSYALGSVAVTLMILFFLHPVLLWPYANRFEARDPSQQWACRVCGYDLRATPDRCPECGSPRLPGA